jgi:hypothetical protein
VYIITHRLCVYGNGLMRAAHSSVDGADATGDTADCGSSKVERTVIAASAAG